ncbi:hypothetical protein [Afifella sp. IM 167]|uniref:hypothetical protein n=1 Tax=Afifella sp. IM 167 TaxID=2033586 RepID=UPI001CD03D3B|nr:hypothetical protein [Afifella sp. IM 167]MBZ8133416.1 hypothetical protein [Afifella sp. IM 167]
MRQATLLFLALLAFLVGLAFIATPIPLGAPLFAASLVLAIAASRRATRIVAGFRYAVPLADKSISFLERRGGRRLGRVLRKTSPRRLPRRPAV